MKSQRRQHTRDLMIEHILDTARVIMREEGVAALSMQELARRMDMRAPSLYNYFSGKSEIYDTLFRLGITLYDNHMKELTRGAESLKDELRISIEGYMSFALQNPELYQLCFERPVPGFVPSEQSLELSFGVLQQFYDRVEQMRDAFQTDLPSHEIVDTIIVLTHGLTALHLANEPHLPMGQGRFGSLIPVFVSLIENAWLTQGDKK